MTSICSGLVVQVVSALLRGNWQDFNWHDASCGPSAIAELLDSIKLYAIVNRHIMVQWAGEEWERQQQELDRTGSRNVGLMRNTNTHLECVVIAGGDDTVAATVHHVDGVLMSADATQQHQSTALHRRLLLLLVERMWWGWQWRCLTDRLNTTGPQWRLWQRRHHDTRRRHCNHSAYIHTQCMIAARCSG